MRTALLVIGYNRPEATARLLEALSADEDGLDRVEIHHYLDGGPGADQDGVVAAIEASEVPYSGLVCRPENYGIGRHLIGAAAPRPSVIFTPYRRFNSHQLSGGVAVSLIATCSPFRNSCHFCAPQQ